MDAHGLTSLISSVRNRDANGNRYGCSCKCGITMMLFCLDCRVVCCRKCHTVGPRHRTLRIVKASREMSIKCHMVENLINISDVHQYYFNDMFVLFLDRPTGKRKPQSPRSSKGSKQKCIACNRMITFATKHRDAVHIARIHNGDFKFCSMGCKMRHIQSNPAAEYTFSLPSSEQPTRVELEQSRKLKGRLIERFHEESSESSDEELAMPESNEELTMLRLAPAYYHSDVVKPATASASQPNDPMDCDDGLTLTLF